MKDERREREGGISETENLEVEEEGKEWGKVEWCVYGCVCLCLDTVYVCVRLCVFRSNSVIGLVCLGVCVYQEISGSRVLCVCLCVCVCVFSWYW